jgi:hypothetical protein
MGEVEELMMGLHPRGAMVTPDSKWRQLQARQYQPALVEAEHLTLPEQL